MRKNKVQVLLRNRPSQNFSSDYLKIQNDGRAVHVCTSKDEKSGVVNNQVTNWSFQFDGIFCNASQEDVFKVVAIDQVNLSLNGYNSTIMCYGQTGAGKTYTITGATENFNNRGLIPRTLSYLYRKIGEDSNSSVTVRISYLEIYNEQMFDLLSDFNTQPATISIIEDDDGNIIVKNLGCHLAQTEEEALNLLFMGESNRATATHILNKRSSRSHCIFTIYLESRSRMQSEENYSVAKLQFVDLAGSERLQKTQSTGKILQEASYINKSLSFLEQTVIALSDKKRDHVPFRQSKLTHFLKDSIGGNSRTVLIANIWSDIEHLEETVSTMRFATRMMRVASEPVQNIKYDPMILVRNLQKEINELKHELNMYDTLHNRGHVVYEALSEQQKFDIREQVKKFADGELAELDIINLRQIQGVYEAFRNLYRTQKQEYEEQLKSLSALTVQSQLQNQMSTVSPSGKQPVKKDRDKATATPSVTAALSETTVPTPTVAAKVGVTEKSSGFGVGQADRNSFDENGGYLQSRRKDRKKIAQNLKPGAVDAKDNLNERDLSNEKISELPSRSDAFEEFKKESGLTIQNILLENKEILAKKKKEYSLLANEINSIKIKIDACKVNLETMKQERECQGPSVTNEGETIITEEEYNEIEKLNENKKAYREKCEELKTIRSAILHCQKMVDLTRQQLLKDFDTWYTESYLDNDPQNKKNSEVHKLDYEDPIEKFDFVKHLKFFNNPDEEAYNRAKESLMHRHVFGDALNQTQPVRRKPGTPVLVKRTSDVLPTHMEVLEQC